MRLFTVTAPTAGLLIDLHTTAEVLTQTLLAWPHRSGLTCLTQLTPNARLDELITTDG